MRLFLFPRQNGYEELGITFVLLNASGDIATTEIGRQSRAHVVVFDRPKQQAIEAYRLCTVVGQLSCLRHSLARRSSSDGLNWPS